MIQVHTLLHNFDIIATILLCYLNYCGSLSFTSHFARDWGIETPEWYLSHIIICLDYIHYMYSFWYVEALLYWSLLHSWYIASPNISLCWWLQMTTAACHTTRTIYGYYYVFTAQLLKVSKTPGLIQSALVYLKRCRKEKINKSIITWFTFEHLQKSSMWLECFSLLILYIYHF